jgi:hypothetical protein
VIILLNGASSSGKTSLLKAIQDTFEEPFLDLGIDKSMPCPEAGWIVHYEMSFSAWYSGRVRQVICSSAPDRMTGFSRKPILLINRPG